MKKTLTILLCISVVFSLIACGSNSNKSSGYEIAMVTDVGTTEDQSFNQGTWDGVEKYATAHNITHTVYMPEEDTDTARMKQIDLAVSNGAKIIITAGYLFEEVIYNAQSKYPNVNFVLVDGNPHDSEYNYKTAINTVGITFSEQEAGYLAGYAAVKDGYTKLGFMGGKIVNPVIRYGYGFVQGAEDAAKEMDHDVEIKYHYTGDFNESANTKTKAAMWYEGGTEVIFSCGGTIVNSITSAAEAANKKVIGVDVDQYKISNTIITSAMKDLDVAVSNALDAFYDNQFPGGHAWVLGAAKGAISLPMEHSNFKFFNQKDYDGVYEKIKNEKIKIPTEESAKAVTDLDLQRVSVELI